MAMMWLSFVALMLLVQSAFPQKDCPVTIARDTWVTVFDPLSKSNKTVTKYTLGNCNKLTAQIISFGASITSIKTPDDKGTLDDVVLGFDDMSGMSGTHD